MKKFSTWLGIRWGSVRALAPVVYNLLRSALGWVSALSGGWEENSFTSLSSQHTEEERLPFQWLARKRIYFPQKPSKNFPLMRTSHLLKLDHIPIIETITVTRGMLATDWLRSDFESFSLTRGGGSLTVIKPITGSGAGVNFPWSSWAVFLINRGSPWLHMCVSQYCNSHSIFAITQVLELRSPTGSGTSPRSSNKWCSSDF